MVAMTSGIIRISEDYMSKKTQRPIFMDDDLYARLQAAGRKEGMTFSAFMRHCALQFIKSDEDIKQNAVNSRRYIYLQHRGIELDDKPYKHERLDKAIDTEMRNRKKA
jgi:hypothetical protein